MVGNEVELKANGESLEIKVQHLANKILSPLIEILHLLDAKEIVRVGRWWESKSDGLWTGSDI